MSNTHCPRCQGLFVSEPAIEDGVKIYLLRCPLCGFYTDETTEQNRRIATVATARTMKGNGQ